jgi:hypothetical protein
MRSHEERRGRTRPESRACTAVGVINPARDSRELAERIEAYRSELRGTPGARGGVRFLRSPLLCGTPSNSARTSEPWLLEGTPKDDAERAVGDAVQTGVGAGAMGPVTPAGVCPARPTVSARR